MPIADHDGAIISLSRIAGEGIQRSLHFEPGLVSRVAWGTGAFEELGFFRRRFAAKDRIALRETAE